MKIYYQFGLSKHLEPDRGDKVNEIGLCLALSTFATVYYSGQLFRPEKKDYGLKDYPGDIPVTPDCDWYIIRNNKEVFDRCEGKRIWISSPYDQEAFQKSTLLFAFTDTWARKLRQGEGIRKLNPRYEHWSQAVPFRQVVLPHFRYSHTDDQSRRQKIEQGGKKTIGVFGRISRLTYPALLLQAFPELFREGHELLFGSTHVKQGWDLPEMDGIIQRSFDNDRMVSVYNGCDVVVVSQIGSEWEFCGNLKTLEPTACGCPVILQRSPAREETLGVDYPFYLKPGVLTGEDTQPLIKLIHKACQVTSGWREQLSKKVLDRHGVAKAGEYLKQLLTESGYVQCEYNH